jgi:hypothetical protein
MAGEGVLVRLSLHNNLSLESTKKVQLSYGYYKYGAQHASGKDSGDSHLTGLPHHPRHLISITKPRCTLSPTTISRRCHSSQSISRDAGCQTALTGQPECLQLSRPEWSPSNLHRLLHGGPFLIGLVDLILNHGVGCFVPWLRVFPHLRVDGLQQPRCEFVVCRRATSVLHFRIGFEGLWLIRHATSLEMLPKLPDCRTQLFVGDGSSKCDRAVEEHYRPHEVKRVTEFESELLGQIVDSACVVSRTSVCVTVSYEGELTPSTDWSM